MNRFNLTANDHLLASPADRLGRAAGESRGGVRWDLIRRLRREIAAGTYASPERWQSAVNNLSDDLAG